MDSLEGDEKTGAKIVLKALEAPLYIIVSNQVLEGSVIVTKVKSPEVVSVSMLTKKLMSKYGWAGILDPAKVTRSALQMRAA